MRAFQLPCPSADERSLPPVANHAFHFFEHSLALFGLLICTGGIIDFVFYGVYGGGTGEQSAPGLGEPNRFNQLLSGATYGLSILLLMLRWRDVISLLARNKALVLVLGIVLFSTFWAVEPGIAARRAAALLLSSGFALWLAMRFSPLVLLKLVLTALLLVAITSIAVIIIAPGIGIHTSGEHNGLWRGTFGHKNQMGRMMSLAVLLALLLVTMSRGKRSVLLCFSVLFTLLVTMTGSATAIAATVLALLVLPASRWLARSQLPVYLLVPLALIGGILLMLLVLSFAEPILTALGRDATLSGRTKLWELALAEGSTRPVLGAGFRTFWLEYGPGSEVMARVSWGNGNIGNGHNAYLDLWLELGLVGLLAYGLLLQETANRIAAMLSEGDPLGPPLAVATVHISAYGITERVLLEHSDLSWLLLTALLLQATPALTPARRSVLV